MKPKNIEQLESSTLGIASADVARMRGALCSPKTAGMLHVSIFIVTFFELFFLRGAYPFVACPVIFGRPLTTHPFRA